MANNCINYKLDKNIHLPPYYFCILCKVEICFNCISSHLVKNINDKKHNINCIVSKESIKYVNNKIIDELIELNKENITYFHLQKKEVEKEKIKLFDIKQLSNDELNELNNGYKNILLYIKKFKTLNNKFNIKKLEKLKI